jgi:hypothetical protein
MNTDQTALAGPPFRAPERRKVMLPVGQFFWRDPLVPDHLMMMTPLLRSSWGIVEFCGTFPWASKGRPFQIKPQSAKCRTAFDQPRSRSRFQFLQPRQHEAIKLSNRQWPRRAFLGLGLNTIS